MEDIRKEEAGGVQSLTVRLPRDEHEQLKTFAFVTKSSINDIVRRAVLQYLAGEGRQQEIDAIIEQVRDTRRVALDKLAGM